MANKAATISSRMLASPFIGRPRVVFVGTTGTLPPFGAVNPFLTMSWRGPPPFGNLMSAFTVARAVLNSKVTPGAARMGRFCAMQPNECAGPRQYRATSFVKPD